ncbi:hypothetical protein B6U96_11340 [Archaeoglobales archaeon ex4484_92]|nr:MAG: hypothetical protein B6U96_11340 [Archaeoglobales archaeon ex4484_92]
MKRGLKGILKAYWKGELRKCLNEKRIERGIAVVHLLLFLHIDVSMKRGLKDYSTGFTKDFIVDFMSQ